MGDLRPVPTAATFGSPQLRVTRVPPETDVKIRRQTLIQDASLNRVHVLYRYTTERNKKVQERSRRHYVHFTVTRLKRANIPPGPRHQLHRVRHSLVPPQLHQPRTTLDRGAPLHAPGPIRQPSGVFSPQCPLPLAYHKPPLTLAKSQPDMMAIMGFRELEPIAGPKIGKWELLRIWRDDRLKGIRP